MAWAWGRAALQRPAVIGLVASTACGLALGVLGPFGSYLSGSLGVRIGYWLVCVWAGSLTFAIGVPALARWAQTRGLATDPRAGHLGLGAPRRRPPDPAAGHPQPAPRPEALAGRRPGFGGGVVWPVSGDQRDRHGGHPLGHPKAGHIGARNGPDFSRPAGPPVAPPRAHCPLPAGGGPLCTGAHITGLDPDSDVPVPGHRRPEGYRRGTDSPVLVGGARRHHRCGRGWP